MPEVERRPGNYLGDYPFARNFVRCPTTWAYNSCRCPLVARLCRDPGGETRQVCPGNADVDFFSYFNGSTGLRGLTPSPLLRVSHDYLWVLRDAFLWNERDPHAPAGIVSEELSELGQG